MKRPIAMEDARGELLRHALIHLEEEGHETLSVRRLAEQAGLSSGAPYYHFSDRRALLLGLALEGFREMNVVAETVLAQTFPSSRARLGALSSAFLDYCDAHPQLIDLMYESELTRPIDAELEPAYRRAFDMIVEVMRDIHPAEQPSRSLVRAVTFWTSLFGLSRLLRQQLLDPFKSDLVGEWRDAILGEIVSSALAAA